jgi:hypothetical protein
VGYQRWGTRWLSLEETAFRLPIMRRIRVRPPEQKIDRADLRVGYSADNPAGHFALALQLFRIQRVLFLRGYLDYEG